MRQRLARAAELAALPKNFHDCAAKLWRRRWGPAGRWLREYLNRIVVWASFLYGRWSGRLSQGRRSHSLRHGNSWCRDPPATAAKSATPGAVTVPGEEALAEAAKSRKRPGEHHNHKHPGGGPCRIGRAVHVGS